MAFQDSGPDRLEQQETPYYVPDVSPALICGADTFSPLPLLPFCAGS